jgi:hypothetical protein
MSRVSCSGDSAGRPCENALVRVAVSPVDGVRGRLHVSQYSGKAFDVEYGRLEVLDHQQDISETKDEVRMGSNPAIVGDARKEIPMLRLHLRLSKQAYASANAES